MYMHCMRKRGGYRGNEFSRNSRISTICENPIYYSKPIDIQNRADIGKYGYEIQRTNILKGQTSEISRIPRSSGKIIIVKDINEANSYTNSNEYSEILFDIKRLENENVIEIFDIFVYLYIYLYGIIRKRFIPRTIIKNIREKVLRMV